MNWSGQNGPEPEAIAGPPCTGERPRRRAERKPGPCLGSAHDQPSDEDQRVTASERWPPLKDSVKIPPRHENGAQ